MIDAACTEINEKSPYTVKYELIKKGNKFHSLELKFKKKNAEKEQLRCPDTIDMFEEQKITSLNCLMLRLIVLVINYQNFLN